MSTVIDLMQARTGERALLLALEKERARLTSESWHDAEARRELGTVRAAIAECRRRIVELERLIDKSWADPENLTRR